MGLTSGESSDALIIEHWLVGGVVAETWVCMQHARSKNGIFIGFDFLNSCCVFLGVGCQISGVLVL